MLSNTIIVTPLQEEYDNLYHNLFALGLNSYKDKIGRLNVDHLPALNVTLVRGGYAKTQFGIQAQYLLDHAEFDLVLCAGAARTLAPEIQVGDSIVATIIEHDYNLEICKASQSAICGRPEKHRADSKTESLMQISTSTLGSWPVAMKM